MKEYMTPEMEIVELKFTASLLAGSNTEPEEDGGGSTSNPNNPGGW